MSVAAASGANNGLRATTNLSNSVSCTKLLWAKFASSPSTYAPLVAATNSAVTAYNQLYAGYSAGVAAVQTASASTPFGSQPTFTNWTCYVLTAGPAGAGSLIGYWQDNAGGGFTSISMTGAAFTNGNDFLLSTGSNVPVAVTAAYYMEWTVVLTPTQLNTQFLSATPVVQTGSVNRYCPMTNSGSAGTDNQNGFNMTVNGSLSTGASLPTFPGGALLLASNQGGF